MATTATTPYDRPAAARARCPPATRRRARRTHDARRSAVRRALRRPWTTARCRRARSGPTPPSPTSRRSAASSLAPMLLLASLGRRSLFVDRHAKEAFNFQVTYLLLFVAALVVALRGTGPTVLGVVAAYGLALAVRRRPALLAGRLLPLPRSRIRFLR